MADHLQRIKLFGTVRLATSYFGGHVECLLREFEIRLDERSLV